jgi:Tol biopolymer transport system component
MFETGAEHTPTRRIVAVLMALVAALGGLLISMGGPAEAAFPGINGKIVFQSDRTMGAGVDNPQGDGEIFSMNPNGTGLAQLTHNDASDSEPAYSAYGNKIAFVRGSDIWVMRSDGTHQTRLTFNITQYSGYAHDPAFSPDGTTIAFSLTSVGFGSEVYTMDSDGSHRKNLSNSPGSDYGPVFSPNGASIAFTSDRDGDEEIYRMRADGTGNPVNLTNNGTIDSRPDFSPDGKRIAYTSYRMGSTEIFTMRADGTDKVRLTRTAYEEGAPVYSPDGKRLAYEAVGSIARVRTDGTSPVFLPHGDSFNARPDWQPLKVFPHPL